MKHIKFQFLLILAKIMSSIIKILGKSSGTSFVGLIILKMCPDFISQASKYITKNIITVTGTNGKTTTSGIMAHIIEDSGASVLNNVKGANMKTDFVN